MHKTFYSRFFYYIICFVEICSFISFGASMLLSLAAFILELEWIKKIIIASPWIVFGDFFLARYGFYAILCLASNCNIYSSQYWRKKLIYSICLFLTVSLVLAVRVDIIAGCIVFWAASSHTLYAKKHTEYFTDN